MSWIPREHQKWQLPVFLQGANKLLPSPVYVENVCHDDDDDVDDKKDCCNCHDEMVVTEEELSDDSNDEEMKYGEL